MLVPKKASDEDDAELEGKVSILVLHAYHAICVSFDICIEKSYQVIITRLNVVLASPQAHDHDQPMANSISIHAIKIHTSLYNGASPGARNCAAQVYGGARGSYYQY